MPQSEETMLREIFMALYNSFCFQVLLWSCIFSDSARWIQSVSQSCSYAINF